MKKYINNVLFRLFLFLLNFSVYAQSYRVLYEVNFKKDTLNRDSATSIIMALDINKARSVFFNFNEYKKDSVYKATTNNDLESSRFMNFEIHKISKAGVQLFRQKKGFDLLAYEDKVVFSWRLINEKKKVLGFISHKAETKFRGRKWIAWYTEDIPVSDGPYKFYGLPGFITEIYDDKNDYHFSIKGIQKSFEPRWEIPSRIYYKNLIRLSRQKFLEEEALDRADPARFFKAMVFSGEIRLADKDPKEIIKGIEEKAKEDFKYYNNPIELIQ
ncbi:GLPGLI family protein [Elizabethkingia meningoseptica]|uniref:GLPGLI family protein n=1 Tax=Elizabethkingia meningoseptica TaxID=238 RepID=UPI0023AF1961|nr:GLPGLI family protein [Elizabethkingia meningoseptica]MDE5436692.1 GLPGLI family protein [Elizabethkingia meningoseptica]MDE5508109.1 GLPGLI family protein [Elizabethkingia meningoseptica]MDE5514799.1 GLPGLI family protein [Elizabethkingia meningoseptica]MDE5525485.1 GLPGLI family protein [Elizabethkingia meningoseptica]MDE5529064.1 GLPGLI family protein [Elizabethkingia meningoseptica]